MKKLYVGNLAWAVTDEDLQSLFSEYGSVASAAVITDRETGRSRGFGFVELTYEEYSKWHDMESRERSWYIDEVKKAKYKEEVAC